MSEPAKTSAPVPAADGVTPAASVIVVRDGEQGLEVLMLRRTAKASFAADAWVFPGGRVDPEDGADPLSLEAARTAAARETSEEAGIVVNPEDLIPYSLWCPPPESPRRFLTWFFVVAVPAQGEVTVDGGEITEHEWVRPADAIAARDAGKVTLLPPTWLTLWDLEQRADVATVLQTARDTEPPYYETHIGFLTRPDEPEKQDVVAMWEGDAGFVARDPSVTGVRRRLRMGDPPWLYEHGLLGTNTAS